MLQVLLEPPVCSDVLAIEGQALARREGAKPVPFPVRRVVVLDLDRHSLGHGPMISEPHLSICAFGISLPQVHADLVLPLGDLGPSALVHEGYLPVTIDLEHAVGHAVE